MKHLCLLLILVASSVHTVAQVSPPANMTTIILAGQSNMSGRGGVTNNTWDHVIPPECRPTASILRFTAKLQWEQAADPLHSDIDIYAVCGVGPGMAFANGVLNSRPGVTLGLVPCAVGNTRIVQWQKGTQFYNTTVERAKVAGGKIEAVLWFQGESDTVNRDDAVSYKWKMERMVQDLRTDLGSPNLLFIQVALASGQGQYLDLVREAQNAVKLNNLVTVDAKGLQLSGDYVHLTTPGQVRLGEMLVAAYLKATTPTNGGHA